MTRKEKLACRVLTHLKYKDDEFIECKFNDMLFFIVEDVLRVSTEKLFQMAREYIDEHPYDPAKG